MQTWARDPSGDQPNVMESKSGCGCKCMIAMNNALITNRDIGSFFFSIGVHEVSTPALHQRLFSRYLFSGEKERKQLLYSTGK